MAKDYHYYASETGADYLAGYRGGPDTEGLGKTTALKMDLFTTPGGDLSVIQNGRDKSGFYFHYPVYKQYGDSSTYRGFKAASYSASLTPLYLEAQATFTGYDAGSGPQTTGSGMLQTSHIFKDGQSYTILQGVDALVTLHSTPRSARTDDTGSVHFRDVTAGQHELVIVADGYEGHQSLHLSGDARQIALTVQVEPTGPLRVVARTSLLGLIILVLMGVVMRARRIASLLRLRRAVMTALRRWSPRSRH